MRIAVLTGSFPLLSETFILRQVTGLLDLGHQVYVYAESRPPPGGQIHAAVRAYDLPSCTTYVRVPASSYWEMPVLPPWGETWLPGRTAAIPNSARLLRALPVIARRMLLTPRLALQSLRPSEYGYRAASLSALYRLDRLAGGNPHFDVIHAHFGPVADNFRFARALWKAPMLVSFHGYDFSTWPRKHGRDVYRRLFGVVDAVTVNSEHTRSRLTGLGCPPGKLHKLPVGLDLCEFPFHERTAPDGPVRLLSVGRLVEKKGLEYALRAVALLRRHYPNIRYEIAGDGPLRSDLRKIAQDVDVQDIVSFHGALGGEAVRRLMHTAHIFVAPSVTAGDGDEEGQGLVLQEAQASGLPVVATDHNGFSESILPGRSGFLVRERDPEALAERLAFLVDHPETWPEMGRAGRAYAEERFDIRKLNLELLDLYEELIERSPFKRR